MCITKVESFGYGGKLYDTELEAVRAALTEIGARLLKDHHSNMIVGLTEMGKDIGQLAERHSELTIEAVERAIPQRKTEVLSA